MLKRIRIFNHPQLNIYVAHVTSCEESTWAERLLRIKPKEYVATLVSSKLLDFEWFVAPSFLPLDIEHHRGNRMADVKLTEMIRKGQHYWEMN